PELFGRMLAKVHLALRVRLRRVRLILEARLVDRRVTRRAAVDACNGLEVGVPVVFLEDDLLDLRDLRLPVDAEVRELFLRAGQIAERDRLELALQIVARD